MSRATVLLTQCADCSSVQANAVCRLPHLVDCSRLQITPVSRFSQFADCSSGQIAPVCWFPLFADYPHAPTSPVCRRTPMCRLPRCWTINQAVRLCWQEPSRLASLPAATGRKFPGLQAAWSYWPELAVPTYIPGAAELDRSAILTEETAKLSIFVTRKRFPFWDKENGLW